jgi:hypothetical protein
VVPQSLNGPLSFYEVMHPWRTTDEPAERLSGHADGELNAMSDDATGLDAHEVTTGTPVAGRPVALSTHALYWSVRGEVACAMHVPQLDSQRWSDERWAEIRVDMCRGHALRYQCQHCAESKTPIVHRRLNRPGSDADA